jgi:L-2,4-diaminobutyric acid acetyltransferase
MTAAELEGGRVDARAAGDAAHRLRTPTLSDAPALHALAAATGVLDVNAVYAYLLVADHFAGTSVVAERDGVVEGFVSAYRLPEEPTTLFVWQVGVAAEARGHGLATRMVLEAVRRAPQPTHLLTTITPSNTASHRLFARVAAALRAPLLHPDHYDAALVTPVDGPAHEPEQHVRIGPIPAASAPDTLSRS